MAKDKAKLSELEQSRDLTDLSASRVRLASTCGLAFQYRYVNQIPAPYDRGAMLFGDAVHNGVEDWYGRNDDPQDHQSRDLAPLVAAQWEKLLPPKVWEAVKRLQQLSEATAAVAAAIKFQRPDLKAPTQTKQYREAEDVQAFETERATMIEMCDALPDVKWPKDEDPWKAYVKSTEIAAYMQRRWQHLPRPLLVEHPFRIEFEGFSIRGRIDQVRMDRPKKPPAVRDLKTGRQPLTQMEAFVQSWTYWKAYTHLCKELDLPPTNDVGFYNCRKAHTREWLQDGRIDPQRHDGLAYRILNGKARQIAMGQFEPNYGMWCRMCDFKELCQNEISIWEGEHGYVLEPL